MCVVCVECGAARWCLGGVVVWPPRGSRGGGPDQGGGGGGGGGGGRGEGRGKGIREGREEAVRGGVGGDGVCRVVGKGGERACVFVHNVQTNKEGMKDGPSSR